MPLTITALRTNVPNGVKDPDPVWTVTAVRRGTLIGLLNLTINRAPATEKGGEKPAMCGWIGKLFVEEDHRGLGLGATLIAEAVRISGEAGCSTCGLLVTHDNPARRLYERQGFMPCWPNDDGLLAHVLPLTGAAEAERLRGEVARLREALVDLEDATEADLMGARPRTIGYDRLTRRLEDIRAALTD